MEVGELWVKLGLDKSGFESGVNEAKGQSSGLGGFIKNAFQFTVGMGMFDLIKTGIKSAWDTSIGFNSQIQQSQAAFTTLLGNGSKASEMLVSLSKMAADTPFELTDLTKASQTLLGFGINANSIMPDLKMLGDVSMGNKDKLQGLALVFAQVQSQGKLMGQDLLQMINNGFNPLTIISQQTGKSMAQLKDEMAKGGISADMVTNAFKGATEKGGLFYGSMDKQSKTFAGQMSTLSDNVRSTLGDVMKPQFEYLSNTILPAVIDKVAKFGDAFKSGGLGAAMKTIIPAGLVDGLTAIGKGTQSAFEWISQHGELVKTLLIGIAAGFASFKTITFGKGIFDGFKAGMEFLPGATGMVSNFGKAFTELKTAPKALQGISGAIKAITGLSPTMIVIIAVVAAIAIAAYEIIKNWGPISTFFKKLWTDIREVFNNIKNHIIDIWNGIKTNTINVWNTIKTFFSTIWNGIKAVVMSIITPFAKGITNIFNGLKLFFTGIWNAIKLVILGLILLICDLITGNFKALSTDAQSIFNGLKNAFLLIWNGIKDIIIGVAQAIWSFLTTIWNGIVSIAISVFNGLSSFFSSIWNGIKNTFISVWNGVVGFFTGLPGKFVNIASGIGSAIKSGFDSAVSFITKLPGEALQWGKDIIDGIVSGIKGAVGEIRDAVSGVAQDIRKFLHFSTPDEGPLKDYESWMPDFIKGMASGIDNNKSKLINSIKGLAGNMALSVQGSMSEGMAGALAGASGGYNTANITVMLDSKILARALGQPLVDEIRARTGIKL